MPREPRAVLFDLDDTLHRRRRFVLSGLRAVAAHVVATFAMDQSVVTGALRHAVRRSPGRELQYLQQALGLPADVVPSLVRVVREHLPAIHLTRAAFETLDELRPAWRLAIVTNGIAEVQARKVGALGLDRLVDTIVYATADGAPGKPSPRPFIDACQRLAVDPARAVFVGDDLTADIAGAAAVGTKTIWLAPRHRPGSVAAQADITVRALTEVPAAARRLLSTRWSPYAA
jgi:putative hydrolase of the HAD superfamily